MRTWTWSLSLAVAAGCGVQGGEQVLVPDDDTNVSDDDTTPAAQDDDTTAAGNDDDSSPAETEPFIQEHVCEGTETYYFTWNWMVEPATVPPPIYIWSHRNQEYEDWYEGWYEGHYGVDYEQPSTWILSTVYSVNDNGELIGGCSWTEYEEPTFDPPYQGFSVDRLILVVEG